jgi:hypothetical protein
MANQSLFKQALILKRRSMKPPARALSRKTRPKHWLYPWAHENKYMLQIVQWISPLQKAVEQYIETNGESVLRGDSSIDSTEKARLDSDYLQIFHKDILPGPGFVFLTKTFAGWIAQYYPDPETNRSPSGIMMGLGTTANGVKKFCDKEWGKQTEPVLGFQFNTAETWWQVMKNQWADTNFKLIKSLATQYIGKVNDICEKAVSNGWSYQTLKQEIEAIGKDQWTKEKKKPSWIKRRAKLIARDQIGKLNGQITQAQQEDAGVNWYIWDTSGDERVRGNPTGLYPKAVPSHWIMQGLLCRWDDATVYSKDGGKTWIPRTEKMPKAHPGQEIQCRCTAIPYMNDLIEEVDFALGDKIKGKVG